MKISPIKNQNFEKLSRKPTYKDQSEDFEEKKNLDISQKKFGSAYAQSPRKCSNIEILAKIEGKKAKYFLKIYEGQIFCFWFFS